MNPLSKALITLILTDIIGVYTMVLGFKRGVFEIKLLGMMIMFFSFICSYVVWGISNKKDALQVSKVGGKTNGSYDVD